MAQATTWAAFLECGSHAPTFAGRSHASPTTGVFSDADINEYVRTYAQPGAMRAGFNFYRALPKDIADNRATLAAGFKLPMPTLGLGGGGLTRAR